MLATLREATEPLTAAEVAQRALKRLGQPPELLDRSTLTSRATTALAKYAKRGILRRLDHGGGTLRWEVARLP